jgi:hypothetical protein
MTIGYSGSSSRPASVSVASRVGGVSGAIARHSRSSSRSSRRSGKAPAKR